MRTFPAVLPVLFVSAAATAQSFNIDFGAPGAGPPASYAAAGQAGHWISVPGTQGVNVFNLVDVGGNVTAAWFNQIGGTQTLLVDDPTIAGDDARTGVVLGPPYPALVVGGRQPYSRPR